MPKVQPPPTPELDKLSKVQECLGVIHEFLEFLESKGIQLAKYPTEEEVEEWNRRAEEESNENYFVPMLIRENLQPLVLFGLRQDDLIYEFFGLDQGKIEQERRSLLRFIRELDRQEQTDE